MVGRLVQKSERGSTKGETADKIIIKKMQNHKIENKNKNKHKKNIIKHKYST